ncbi:MAG: toprim domain-containing protein [Patescibacteria group bacterium]|nr:toprim domain-containing protein [Patescibacteria group bacterium]
MNPIDRLSEMFEHFPGIGPRQARRFVQYLLSAPQSTRAQLADTVSKLGQETLQCKRCYRWFTKTEARQKENQMLCPICADERREHSLFVVEKDADLEQVERAGFRGVYFVLGGTIPLASEEPHKHVRLKALVARVEGDATDKKLQELILGLSATAEGDHTRQYLVETLESFAQKFNFKITSLGRGLSTGSELEYADPDTIQNALSSRH